MSPRWIILRTSGGRTLRLAEWLCEAGFEAWTPARTLRRNMRAKTPSGTRVIETVVPILPTFVFARADDLYRLLALAAMPMGQHPGFSIFRHDGKAPEIGDASIAGLRAAEAKEAATLQAIRDAETYEEAEKIRIAAIKSESARRRAERELERGRRKARRSQGCTVAPGTEVEVTDMPALVGVTGVVESTDGAFAHVVFGTRSWKIEGWRVIPAALQKHQAPRGIAA